MSIEYIARLDIGKKISEEKVAEMQNADRINEFETFDSGGGGIRMPTKAVPWQGKDGVTRRARIIVQNANLTSRWTLTPKAEPFSLGLSTIRNGGVMRFLIGFFILMVISGCADSLSFSVAGSVQVVGFWYGFWHGTIAPFAWMVSLFSDSTAIYAIYNNGGWYDFGFMLGIGALTSSSSTAVNRR